MKARLGISMLAISSICALSLSGCLFGSHDIIAADEQCTSCHEEKTTYEVSNPKDAMTVGNELQIKTSASTVIACKPIFTSEDGSSYVPQRSTQATARDGQATLTLEDGIWAICAAEDDKVTAEKIVIVDSSLNQSTAFEL